MGHAIEGLSDHERIQAKSWADYVFHNAPQTEKFFDANTSIGDIKNRQEQKIEARNNGESLQAKETMKYFERSNVTTITHNLRPSFNQYFEFALKGGATNIESALSTKTMLKYISFLEEKVYSRDITPDTFKEYASRMRILASMVTSTEGLPTLNIDKMTTRATNNIKAYVEKMKDTDKPVINDKHKIHAYTSNEMEKIIDGIKNEKVKLALEIIKETGFRIENAETLFLNTQWKKVGPKQWEREYTDANKVAIVSKGNQRHTVTLSPELFNRLKEYVNKNKVFHIDRSTIQKNAKKSAKEQGIKYISIHNFRATVAYRLFNDLIDEGYSENEARKAVSKKLYHGRGDITIYYVRSAR
ncbi:MAG: site-specific integrase [Lactobacillus sp.]|nr:site-specific integrase [Lactobacillus sp.]